VVELVQKSAVSEKLRQLLAATVSDNGPVGAQLGVVLPGGTLVESVAGSDFAGRRLLASDLLPIYCLAKPLLGFALCRALQRSGHDRDLLVRSALPWAEGFDHSATVTDLLTGRLSLPSLPPAFALALDDPLRRKVVQKMQATRADRPTYNEAACWLVLEELARSVLGIGLAELAFDEVVNPAGAADSMRTEILPGDFHRHALRLALDGTVDHDVRIPHLGLNRPSVATLSAPQFLSRASAGAVARSLAFAAHSLASNEPLADWYFPEGEDGLTFCAGGLYHLRSHLSHDQGRPEGAMPFGSFSGGAGGVAWAYRGTGTAACVIACGMLPGDTAARQRLLALFDSVEQILQEWGFDGGV
jgi:hypothetical protein